jgi:methionyl-tRNA formyltransferase
MRDPHFVDRIREIAPEVCPVVAFGGMITDELLRIPPRGWINLHYSLLPAFRGAAPVQRALLEGVKTTGVTVFKIVKALDAGPWFVQREVEVEDHETAGDLLDRLSILGAQAMVDGLDLAEKGIVPSQQSATGITLAPKFTVKDARLDMGAPAQEIVHRIRAMSPEPGAWAMLGEQRFKILRAQVAYDSDQTLQTAMIGNAYQDRIGAILPTKKKIYCRTIDGWIELIQVQAVGKKPMVGADWARGVLGHDREGVPSLG